MNEAARQGVARVVGYAGLLLALFAALTPGYFYIPGVLAVACGVVALYFKEGYLGFLALGFGMFGMIIGLILTIAGFRLGK